MSETPVEYRAGKRICMEQQPHWKVLQGVMSEEQSKLRQWLEGNADSDGVSDETRVFMARIQRCRIKALHEGIRVLKNHWEMGGRNGS